MPDDERRFGGGEMDLLTVSSLMITVRAPGRDALMRSPNLQAARDR
jgi:hypothetical protein